MNMSLKGVIFDLDGVLIDSETHSKICFIKACEINKVFYDEDFYVTLIGKNKKEMNELCLNHFKDETIFNNVNTVWRKLYRDGFINGDVALKAGAKEIIEYLKENNIPYALATSSPRMMIEVKFSNLGYDEVPFKYIITGDEVNKSKPDPEIFIKAAKMMNLSNEECIVIEDSLNGVKAARASKSVVCLVPDILKADEEMMSYVDIKYNNLFEVINYLKKNIS